MATKAQLCTVCKAVPKKYKCPGCLAGYCSSACFAVHKEDCKPLPQAPAPVLQMRLTEKKAVVTEEHVELLSERRLARLAEDKTLVQALADPRLQRLLLAIDGSEDPREALSRAKLGEGKQFQDVIDRMLIAVGVAVKNEDGSVTFTGGGSGSG